MAGVAPNDILRMLVEKYVRNKKDEERLVVNPSPFSWHEAAVDLYLLGYYSQYPPVSKICHSFDSKHNHITFLVLIFFHMQEKVIMLAKYS